MGNLEKEDGSGTRQVKGLPLLGVLLPIRRDPLEFFSRVLRQHGDRVRFRVLGRRVLLLCHPDDLEQVLVQERACYGRSDELLALRVLFGDGLLASEGDLWRRQRKMIQPSFQHGSILRYSSLMLSAIQSQVARWNPDEVLDIHFEMMRYTRNAICAVLFGDDHLVRHAAIGEAVSTVFGDLRTEILYLQLWRRLPFRRNRNWNRAAALLNRSIQALIRERRVAGSTAADLLGDLLSARDADGQSMSDRQVHDEVLTFFLAGHETAALALTWALYLLANDSDAQEKARREVALLARKGGVQVEHVPQLRYVTAVAKEALRLYPPVWSLGRKASADCRLGGETVVKGTALWLCIHRLHRDERWFPEPDRFLPERWLEDCPAKPFTYLPFGMGPRVCIGQHFAMTEVVLGLAAVLNRFRFALVSGLPAKVSPWITLRPKDPIFLRLAAAADHST